MYSDSERLLAIVQTKRNNAESVLSDLRDARDDVDEAIESTENRISSLDELAEAIQNLDDDAPSFDLSISISSDDI